MPLPSRALRWWAGLTRALLWLVAGAWLLFALTAGVLHLLIVPRIAEWRPQLESVASQALGVKVQVGDIRAESTGAIPAFELRDVRIFDPQGREALLLQRVQASLSVRSLWRRGFEQLVIQAPVLDVRRTAQGHIEVAGIDVSAEQQDQSTAAADWFFSQTEFVIRDGVVRWTDEFRPDAPPVALTALDLVVRNPGHRHQMRLDATPPPEWGERFGLQGQFRRPLWQLHAGRWRSWSGTVYTSFSDVNLRHLRQYLDMPAQVGMELQEGRGALRLWADVKQGQVVGVTSDVALSALAVRMQAEREPLQVKDLSGRFVLNRDDKTLELATRDLAFQTLDGLVWPGGNVRYGQTLDEQDQLAQLRLDADRLDLDTIGRLADHLPLPAQVSEPLTTLAPTGQIDALSLNWNASDGKRPMQWQAKGQVSRLAMKAGPADPPYNTADGRLLHPLGRPGFSGVNVTFDATQAGGQAQVQVKDGALEFPGMFEEPRLDFQEIQTNVTWKLAGERMEVDIPRLRMLNDDLKGDVKVHWRTSDPATSTSKSRFPGVLDLTGTLERANGARVFRYLPQDIPLSARQYVREAVRKAEAKDARFVVKGDLWDFPFAQAGSGDFSVRTRLSGVELAYVPPYLNAPGTPSWPSVQNLSADFRIDRVALHIANGSGSVLGLPQLKASQADARIDDFTSDTARLQVQAKVNGPAADALAFVNRSPLLRMTGEALRQASITGSTDLQFGLDMPLHQVDATKVTGQVRFSGNDLQVTPDTPWLRNTNAQLSFSEKGFRVSRATARLLGGDARFDGGMQEGVAGSVIRFQGQGVATADGLRQAKELGMLADVGRTAQGSASYQAQLEFRPNGTDVLVESNLVGMGVNLPAPLNKTAQQPLPLRYEVRALPMPAGGTVQQDRMTVELGAGPTPVVSARYEREHAGAQTRVLRGAVSVRSERLDLPASGVLARVSLNEVDLQAWERSWQTGNTASTTAGPPPKSVADTRAYWPTTFGVEIRELKHDGRSFHDLVAGGSRDRDTWRLTLNARELNGYIEYQDEQSNGPGRLYARLASMNLPQSSAADVENLMQEQPRTMPALDIVVNEFTLNNRSLGKLEIDAINRPGRSGNEWRLNKLNLSVPEAQLQTSGSWLAAGRVAGSGRVGRTTLNLKLKIDDSGALLGRFGMAGVVRGGKGQIDGTLGWAGSPLGLHYPSLNGQLEVGIERGQFLKADPGLAKLLGVLSLQSLPRRLILDFRDVFSEGFAFDFVRGNVRVEQGVASTNNLQMKGVNAAVLMEGQADIARETQDITAVVVPELNAGTASLVASMINPVTGLSSFLAQFILRGPLQAAATQTFHVTGTWADPQVEKVERRNNVPAPNSEGGSP